jgi:hypothetical protein
VLLEEAAAGRVVDCDAAVDIAGITSRTGDDCNRDFEGLILRMDILKYTKKKKQTHQPQAAKKSPQNKQEK